MQRADMSNDVRSQLSRFLMGANFMAYDFLGVHAAAGADPARTVCRVWAPNAKAVSVAGDFNGWKPGANPMEPVGGGVWECSLPFRMKRFEPYKFCMEKQDGGRLFKVTPMLFLTTCGTAADRAMKTPAAFRGTTQRGCGAAHTSGGKRGP